MQMTLASQGRSASALTGALSGSGTLTLESSRVAGLDPRAFDVAIRASDNGQATDDNRLRQIVEPVHCRAAPCRSHRRKFRSISGMAGFALARPRSMPKARAPSSRVDTTLPADQADIRASLASTATGSVTSRPEIQLFAVGSPDALDRTVDVAALSSWLALRAIDRETRRLDSIERGDRPPLPASIRRRVRPSERRTRRSDQPLSGLPTPGRNPTSRRPQNRGSVFASAGDTSNSQCAACREPAACAAPAADRGSSAPGTGVARPPKPKPPLVLTPPVAGPQRSAF
jgi:large subunit ribosomal protein L24